MKVRDLMTQSVRTCSPDSSLAEAAKIMAEVNCGAVPVVEGQKLAGIITDRDIVLRGVAKGQDISGMKVRECMSSPVITVAADIDAHEAADIMASKQIRRLCVVDGERISGIVALGDMATAHIHVDEAGEALSTISEPAAPGAH